jgi:PTH1 family peptidyl-tRNA hydrolase
MKAIVGLGNPGPEYAGTRHNVGFVVVDEVARRWDVRLKAWKGIARLAMVSSRGALLAEPQTFMNASGDAVARLLAFHRVDPAEVLVVVDDVQLPLGRLRLRREGSAGGHNGLKSIIQQIGTGFPRLRIGIGRGDPLWDLADHVLAPFRPDERAAMEQALTRAADAVETFVDEGIGAAMNRFNVRDEMRSDSGDDQERPVT